MIGRYAVAAVVLLAAAGCKKGPPEITTLTGRVTLDGAPVTAGIVNVSSEDDVTRTSAEIGSDGTYTMIGAPVGKVRVSVSTEDYRMLLPEPGSKAGPRKNPLFVATPKTYEAFDSSGLATEVPSGKAQYDIALTSK